MQYPTRTPLIAGNWKLNTTRESASALATAVRAGAEVFTHTQVVVAPPAVWLTDVAGILADAPGHIKVAAQNVAAYESGAYTGEVSALMVVEVASYTILGHSERTHVFGETAEVTRLKLQQALQAGLNPILCVGEDVEMPGSEATVAESVRELLQDLLPEQYDQFTIAYEPVWAIGTGKAATPEYATPVLAAIRQVVGEAARVLYGGSVSPDNAESFLSIPDCDGLLVGGASLKSDSFLAICAAAEAVAAHL